MLFTTINIYHGAKLLIVFASYSFHLWSLLDCGFLLGLSREHCFSGQAGEQDHVIFGVRDLWEEEESTSSSSSYLEECNKSFYFPPYFSTQPFSQAQKSLDNWLTSSFMVRWGQITYILSFWSDSKCRACIRYVFMGILNMSKYLDSIFRFIFRHFYSKNVHKDGGYHYAAKQQ